MNSKRSWTISFNIFYIFFSLSIAAMAIDIDSNNQGHPYGISSSGLNTTVNFQNNQYDITGGTQKGNNLFHSFERFNVHSGESAVFHDEGIQNTIGRVTGNQYSWINGQISSQAENLYLMNPNGWMFGPDASLDFTIEHIKKELNNTPYNTLHFSTHGTFGNNPQEIQLNTYDKPINLNNLNNIIAICNYRKQPIDLLTLSACDTARGDDRAALGLGGVAVKTGVATAVASLWKVDDKASAEIMALFYQSLKNNSGQKAQSLRLAQISMIESDKFSHPSYWAPFVLMGAW